MSYNVVLEARNVLVNDADVTSLVSPTNIRVGWSEGQISMPAIIISIVGETDTGYLGFGTAPEGSRIHRVVATLQFDILSKSSVKETLQIDDAMTEALLENGYSKITETDMWDNYLKAHRRIVRFRKTYIKEM